MHTYIQMKIVPKNVDKNLATIFAHTRQVLAVVALRVIGVSVRSTHVVGPGVRVNVGTRVGAGGALNGDRSKVGLVLVAINLLKSI